MSSSQPPQRSSYERRLARQRQLELMEAAASGTAPSMELETSVETPLRSRTSVATTPSQQQQPPPPPATPTAAASSSPSKSMRSSQLFERPDTSRPSVNLMDHTTGVYTEPTMRDVSIWRRLTGLFRLTSDNMDASVEDYVGEAPTKRRLSPMRAFCYRLLRYRWCQFLLLLFGIAILTTTTLLLTHKPQAQKVWVENENRLDMLKRFVLTHGVSHSWELNQTDSAESHALRWLAYSDPLRMDPVDPNILYRYGLAVLFYSSYLGFLSEQGQQAPITKDGEQWVGVPHPGWRRYDHWMTGKGHCQWYGVECEAKYEEGDQFAASVVKYDGDAPIITLALRGNRVRGTIPNEFKAFDSITFLDLSENQMHGTIPWEVGRMRLLKHLVLSKNKYTGSLSTHVGNLLELHEMRVDNNQLTGPLPNELGRLTNLRWMSFNDNKLSGPLPAIGSCEKLETLMLDDNFFNSSIPIGWSRLTDLVELHLHNNNITGSLPPELGNIRNIEVFSLDFNLMTGTLPAFILDALFHIRYFNCQHNLMTGALPKAVDTVPTLEEIYLNHNKFTGPLPPWAYMPALKIVHVNDNQLNGQLPTTLGGLPSMTEFWGHSNAFTGPIPSELGRASSLHTLYLDRNYLVGQVPSSLGGLSHLQVLRLGGNRFSGTMPQEICARRKAANEALLDLQVSCVFNFTCDCCRCV